VDSAFLESPVSPSEQIPAVELCSWDHKPYGVVSLLDMLKQYAFSFYEVISRLEKIKHRASLLGSTSSYGLSTNVMSKFEREELSTALKDMRKECETLTLGDTVDRIDFIESEVVRKGEHYSYVDTLKDLDHLNHSFSSGLRKRFFFGIKDDNKKYFQVDDLAGPKVNSAFPLCASEIKNAGNCYALEQDDACVFHCMCALEVALRVLANKLGVTFAGTLDLQNWQNIIENIESEIKNLEKLPKSTHKSETLKFLSGAAMQFRWFKDAWRNHVMHGRDIYDPGKAFSIFDHVREFMQALAEGGLTE
jgi:hypothetical protein